MSIIIETIVRDEDYILNEWIIHHLLLGFKHIYIYDDASIIPVEKVILELPENYRNKITVYRLEDNYYLKDFIYSKYYDEVIYNKYKNFKQLYFMNYFLKQHKHVDKWCLFIDCDEFIYLKNNNILEYLSNKDIYDTIYIRWLNYGTSFNIDEPEGLVINNFIYHAMNYNNLGKSILKLQNIDINNIHKLNMNLKMLDNNGLLYEQPIHINHYVTTSLKRYIRRKLKSNIGQFNGNLRDPNEYFTSIFESNYINSKLNFKYFSKIYEYITNINKILKRKLNDNIIYKSNVLKINETTIIHHIKTNTIEFLHNIIPNIDLLKLILNSNVRYCNHFEIIKNIDIDVYKQIYPNLSDILILNHYLHNNNDYIYKDDQKKYICLQLFRKTK